ncbi:MAG: NAD(P)-dependent oxidoreductase [Opitutaceae bacterium]|jgi:nucleoside-diphosphate-sugar epimerase
MHTVEADSFIAKPNDLILITGATGFIGRSVVRAVLDLGFKNIRCLARPSSRLAGLNEVLEAHPNDARVEVVSGNLLSTDDCAAVAEGAVVILHLAAGKGEKAFPDAFMNSVVTTRNLLDACLGQGSLRRFVNISSFAVYANHGNPRGRMLEESCPLEDRPEMRGAYCFAKTEQDKLVMEYGERHKIPYVLIRPGYVFGPGSPGIHTRVGIGTFGIFLHLGGGNRLPVTYVDNCADAIAMAGLTKGVDGEVFNVVDDDLPSSRKFLWLYKRKVKSFKSIYLPHALSYLLCSLWGWYADWSQGQLPSAYNRKMWRASWKRTRYSNAKLKSRTGWRPKVSTKEALERHFESCRASVLNA